MKIKEKVVRPGGLELPTFWFVATLYPTELRAHTYTVYYQ